MECPAGYPAIPLVDGWVCSHGRRLPTSVRMLRGNATVEKWEYSRGRRTPSCQHLASHRCPGRWYIFTRRLLKLMLHRYRTIYTGPVRWAINPPSNHPESAGDGRWGSITQAVGPWPGSFDSRLALSAPIPLPWQNWVPGPPVMTTYTLEWLLWQRHLLTLLLREVQPRTSHALMCMITPTSYVQRVVWSCQVGYVFWSFSHR